MDIQEEREALIVEIERFKAEAFKMYFIETWSESYKTDPFSYAIDDENKIIWMKAQARQLWDFWQTAQKVAVPDTHILMPKEPTSKHAEAFWNNFIVEQPNAQTMYFAYKAMIEAQE